MNTVNGKLKPKRVPVNGFMNPTMESNNYSGLDWFVIRHKKTDICPRRVKVADASVYKAVPKKGRKSSPVRKGFAFIYHNRLLFNGDGNITCCSVDSDKTNCRSPIIIVDTKSHSLVKRAGVKRLEVERPYPKPHDSHSMTKWRTEARAPAGTSRFYAVRNCKNCKHEQSYHAAGTFSDAELKTKCVGHRED
jgi:ribosomal protein S27E